MTFQGQVMVSMKSCSHSGISQGPISTQGVFYSHFLPWFKKDITVKGGLGIYQWPATTLRKCQVANHLPLRLGQGGCQGCGRFTRGRPRRRSQEAMQRSHQARHVGNHGEPLEPAAQHLPPGIHNSTHPQRGSMKDFSSRITGKRKRRLASNHPPALHRQGPNLNWRKSADFTAVMRLRQEMEHHR